VFVDAEFQAVLRVARHLVVMHIDGLGADSLEEALREGDMPFTKHLIDDEVMPSTATGAASRSTTRLCRQASSTATTPRYQASAGGTRAPCPRAVWPPVVVQEGGGQILPRLQAADAGWRLHCGLLPGRRQGRFRHRLSGPELFEDEKSRSGVERAPSYLANRCTSATGRGRRR